MPHEGRLMGLETEYALRISANSDDSVSALSHRDAYESICRSLCSRLPAAEADPVEGAKLGWFLGTGGAVWFESLMPTSDVGLVEGATPECRRVRDLVACQRAQDRLLSEAAQQSGVSLIKNCHDADGNVYGAQESYEVPFGPESRLRWWRYGCFLVVLPCAILLQLGAIAGICCLLLTLPITALIHQLRCLFVSSPQTRQASFDFWVGRSWRKGWNGFDVPLGGWLGKSVLRLAQLLAFPVTCAVFLLLHVTDLPRIHRQLCAFLVTRMLFTGAGRVLSDGSFLMAEKAEAVNCVTGLPEYSRPMLSIGQFIKPAIVLVRFAELLKPRQRVQISIGDSNLCEEAEFLRVGTTLLVIDLICSRQNISLPQLRNPIRSMRALSRDFGLEQRFRLKDGTDATGLEIQRLYLEACRQYVSRERQGDAEANEVIERWGEILDCLERDPELLIGRVDWVTKKFLLDQAEATASIAAGPMPMCESSVAARQKIDVKYHELTENGYFRQFETTGLHQRLLDAAQIEAAMRLPPAGTPATTRARLIREYSGAGLKVGWRKLSNGMKIE